MTNKQNRVTAPTQSGIAYNVGQLMIANVKDAFKTNDPVSISKYLKIANIIFSENK